jgi:ribonuclease HII
MPVALVAGVDEAGRGPLAGPVVAACVLLDPVHPIAGLADSKTLSSARREALAACIREHALAWAIGEASVAEIDELNILRATLLAMARAVEGLSVRPDEVLVDGLHCPAVACRVRAVIRGDATVPSISAASILAKTVRDATMVGLHAHHPGYGFDRHKGYPTAEHVEALRRLGPIAEHRRSFAPVRAAIAALG